MLDCRINIRPARRIVARCHPYEFAGGAFNDFALGHPENMSASGQPFETVDDACWQLGQLCDRQLMGHGGSADMETGLSYEDWLDSDFPSGLPLLRSSNGKSLYEVYRRVLFARVRIDSDESVADAFAAIGWHISQTFESRFLAIGEAIRGTLFVTAMEVSS